jgi:hypothetical protein
MKNELKEFFSEMEGLEKFNWYVLKPIALILCIGIMIIL